MVCYYKQHFVFVCALKWTDISFQFKFPKDIHAIKELNGKITELDDSVLIEIEFPSASKIVP